MYQVSSFSITFMMVSMITCIFAPIILCTYYKKKGASIKSFIIGALTFIIFALILEQIVHVIVMNAWGDIFTNPKYLWVKAIYGGMAAAAFEEMGRYLAMKFVMKKKLNKKEALMYGAGHGGIEAFIIGGLAGISNLATAISVNTGGLDEAIQAGEQAIISVVEEMVALAPYQFLLMGIERLSAMTLHICLSYLVYLAVKNRKIEYLSMALVVHFLVDAGTILLAEVIPVAVIELVLIVVDLVFVYWINKLYHQEPDEE